MERYTLLHLNIEKHKHIDVVIEMLEKHQPDFVCLEEAFEDDVMLLVDKFGYHYAYAARLILDTGELCDEEGSAILSRYPLRNIRRDRYGDEILSRVPQFSSDELRKQNDRRPDEQFLFFHNLLSAEVVLEGGQVTIATTHFPVADLTTPGHEDHEIETIDDLYYIQHVRSYFDKFLEKLRKLPNPIIFTADLNNPRGRFVYDALAHELIDYVPKSLKSSLDPELHRKKNLELMVDTVMVSHEVEVGDVTVIEGVSDHKGFLVTFNLEG